MVTESVKPPSALSLLFDEWEREKHLRLRLKHWRLILEADDNPTIDRQTIEITASWQRGFAGDALFIGDLKEKLEDLPITVAVVRAGDIIAEEIANANATRKLELEPESRERTEFAGWLNYYPPTDYDVKTEGSIYAKVILSAPSFDYIRGQMCGTATPDVTMQLKIRFPTKENDWDGKGTIDVTKLVIVFPHNCDATGEPLDDDLDDDSDNTPDAAAMQLTASNNIAANLANVHKTIMWASAAIIVALIVFR